MNKKILIVDDEEHLTIMLSRVFEIQKFEAFVAATGARALELLDSERFDLMICDIRMNPMNGMEILKEARQRQPDMACIMVTAYSSVDTAIEAMRIGAFDYVTKPFNMADLIGIAQDALKSIETKRAMQTSLRPDAPDYIPGIIAENPAMQRICDGFPRVASADTPVLIHGEDGTGRHLVARTIHAQSARASQPFVYVDCEQLPRTGAEKQLFGEPAGSPGVFGSAHGGSIYFRSIELLPLPAQAALVASISEKEKTEEDDGKNAVPVRLIASTVSDLKAEAGAGRFLRPLYLRLAGFPIHLPPLRERKEDILPIAFSLLDKLAGSGEKWSIDYEARLVFETHSWPGNCREIENAIRYALVFAEDQCIVRKNLPPKIAATPIQEEIKKANQKISAMQGQHLKKFLEKKKDEFKGSLKKAPRKKADK